MVSKQVKCCRFQLDCLQEEAPITSKLWQSNDIADCKRVSRHKVTPHEDPGLCKLESKQVPAQIIEPSRY